MDPITAGHLEIRLGFRLPFAAALYLLRPRISINGHVEIVRWGIQTRTLPGGSYGLAVWIPWIVKCRAFLAVNIIPGQMTCVRYRPTFLGSGRLDIITPKNDRLP